MSAVRQILSQPHVRLTEEYEEVTVRRSTRMGGQAVRQFASRYPREAIPPAHPLALRLAARGCIHPTIPTYITVERFEETLDTPENQFFKYVLESFETFLDCVESRLVSAGAASKAIAERDVAPLRRILQEILTAQFFTEISQPQSLPLGSPALQRKSGYREILQAWIKFNAAARLVWNGGEEVYGAGKRDVAVLYEYWLFFVLWGILSNWASDQAELKLASTILEPTADGFGLKLRSGTLLAVEGLELMHKGRQFRFQFSYNRTFTEAAVGYVSQRLEYRHSHPKAGSWTRRMRPDFTLSFWPSGIDPAAAEEADLMVHVHFDSKYSVTSLNDLFGSDDLNEEKRMQRSGTYKRADLLKMHAYRDAIRRSYGAYILYPGVDEPQSLGAEYTVWLAFHEILPGLGAFTAYGPKTRAI